MDTFNPVLEHMNIKDLFINKNKSMVDNPKNEEYISNLYKSTEDNLKIVLNQFKSGGSKEMGADDMLVLFWIGHGGGGSNVEFKLGKGDVEDNEFADYVNYLEQNNLNIFSKRVLHAAIGISGEAGELLGAVKKSLVYHSPFDIENCREELGDILHYMQMLMNEYGWTFSELMDSNYTKLMKRYPDGYSNEAALERKDKNDKD